MRKIRMITIVMVVSLSIMLVYLSAVALSAPAYLLDTTLLETTPCPVAKPEPLWVEPVTSPTRLLTQTIVIYAGNSEWVAVDTGFEVFTETESAYRTEVEIDLVAGQVHDLEASSRVRTIMHGDCEYGGYTLKTRYDRYGKLLEIVQQSEITYLPLLYR